MRAWTLLVALALHGVTLLLLWVLFERTSGLSRVLEDTRPWRELNDRRIERIERRIERIEELWSSLAAKIDPNVEPENAPR